MFTVLLSLLAVVFVFGPMVQPSPDSETVVCSVEATYDAGKNVVTYLIDPVCLQHLASEPTVNWVDPDGNVLYTATTSKAATTEVLELIPGSTATIMNAPEAGLTCLLVLGNPDTQPMRLPINSELVGVQEVQDQDVLIAMDNGVSCWIERKIVDGTRDHLKVISGPVAVEATAEVIEAEVVQDMVGTCTRGQNFTLASALRFAFPGSGLRFNESVTFTLEGVDANPRGDPYWKIHVTGDEPGKYWYIPFVDRDNVTLPECMPEE